MEFTEIKAQIRNLSPDSIRVDDDCYLEAVFNKESIGRVMKALEEILGKPLRPSQDKIPGDTQKLIDGFGGLRKGQTLFFSNKDGVSLFAMLWPWQDGENTTIKLGKV